MAWMLSKISSFIVVYVLIGNSMGYAEDLWKKYKVKAESYGQTERVFIDNKYIQTYKEHSGLWMNMGHGQSMERIAEKYGTTREEIIAVNEIKNPEQKVFFNARYFIPFSDDYREKLESMGIKRHHRDVPHGEFIWPMVGSSITQKWGVRSVFGTIHSGVDMAAPIGTTVVAAGDGIILHSGFEGGYGYTVVIQHQGTLITRYAHLSQTILKKGDKVKRGQLIAFSGNTGQSTGAHLHFEIRQNDVSLDPESFLSEFKETMKEYVHFSEDQLQMIRNNQS